MPLFCFIDKYKGDNDKSSNEETIEVTRELNENYIDEIKNRDKNLGTALNVTASVNEVLCEYENVFVIEDDLEFVKNSKI